MPFRGGIGRASAAGEEGEHRGEVDHRAAVFHERRSAGHGNPHGPGQVDLDNAGTNRRESTPPPKRRMPAALTNTASASRFAPKAVTAAASVTSSLVHSLRWCAVDPNSPIAGLGGMRQTSAPPIPPAAPVMTAVDARAGTGYLAKVVVGARTSRPSLSGFAAAPLRRGILRLSETRLVYRAEARSQTGTGPASASLCDATARHPSRGLPSRSSRFGVSSRERRMVSGPKDCSFGPLVQYYRNAPFRSVPSCAYPRGEELASSLVSNSNPISSPENEPVETARANSPRNARGSVGGTALPIPRGKAGPVASHSTRKSTWAGVSLARRTGTCRSPAGSSRANGPPAVHLELDRTLVTSSVQKSPDGRMPPLKSFTCDPNRGRTDQFISGQTIHAGRRPLRHTPPRKRGCRSRDRTSCRRSRGVPTW